MESAFVGRNVRNKPEGFFFAVIETDWRRWLGKQREVESRQGELR